MLRKYITYRISRWLFLCLVSFNVSAIDVLSVRTIGLDLAADIASTAIKECRKAGYQVSVVVVDRNGVIQVAMRDDLASRFTLQIAEEKANAVILSGVTSSELSKNRTDIKQELNHIDGLIVMAGGVQIVAGGHNIGAIGISGAPGGDLDEDCALKTLKQFAERLEFAE
ncbi:MAG: heme-binding protein [Gammaproteobacteria bacterium]|nr:heme-binding protein [Gammaproteobacteria bacterium]